jgi:integrase
MTGNRRSGGPARKRTSAQRGLRGTVYRRGSKWAYMIDLDADLLTGKRQQRAKSGFETEQSAWDALAEANAELRTDAYVAPSKRTVSEFFDEWLAGIQMSVKPTTFANYSTYARAYVVPVIGSRKLQDLEPATITAFYLHLLTHGRRRRATNHAMYEWWISETAAGRSVRPTDLAKKVGVTYSAASNAIRRYRAGRIPPVQTTGLSARAVASVHVMLHRALRDAAAAKYIRSNPAALAEVPRAERQPHSTWTPAQLGQFLRHVQGDRLYAMWLLFATTGVRRSEAVGAVRSAFDAEAGTITVVSTRVIAGGKAQSSTGKTRRSRPGDKVVLTGTMQRGRAEIVEHATAVGLRMTTAVSKKTSVVVAADPDSLSGKAKDARAIGVPVVNEHAFLRVLAEMPSHQP